MKLEKAFTIRSYRATDRGAVRRLCCPAGVSRRTNRPGLRAITNFIRGFPDEVITRTRNLNRPSVLEIDGEIRGYLIGSRKPLWNQFYSFRQNIRLFVRALWRYPLR